MIDRGKIIREMESQYKLKEQTNREIRLEREQEVRQKHPEIGEMMDGRWAILFSGVGAIGVPDQGVDNAPEKMDALNKGIRRALVKHGYPEDYLQPHFDCPICKDTGYMGGDVREMCQCFKTAYHQRLFKEVGLSEQTPQTFETFDENVYDAAVLQGIGYSQRDVALLHKKAAMEYADAFPNAKASDLLLLGGSGVGKTFLLHAIAHRVLERGYSVLCVGAYKVIELARRAHFQNDPAEMESLMDVDLLLIDDLGTEPMMENITIPYLYNLINTRQQSGKHTVITTNLQKDEIKSRYTERIASRLLNSRQCHVMAFVGEDVRRRPQK